MRARADLRAVRCAGFALTAVALLGSGRALATPTIGTITLRPDSPPPVGRTDKPEAIGSFDCLAKRPLDYDVSTTEGAGLVLDVLVNFPGQNCGVTTNSDVDYNVCASALANPITVATDTVFVKLVSTDVVTALTMSPTTASTLDGGAASLCQGTGGTALPQKITLTFVLLNGLTVSAFKQMTLLYDLMGPPPPTGVKAGIGEQRLIVSWTAGSTTDLLSYRFYCDPPPSGTTSTASFNPAAAGTTGIDAGTGGTLGTGGSMTTGGTGGLAGSTTGGVGGVGGTSGADSGVATGGATTGTDGSSTGGADASTTFSLCSGTLQQGSFPVTVDATAGTWKELPTCGSVGSTSTSGEARPLQNGTEYTVAVAGVDALGNIGPLSNVACGTPKAVTDFFEAYRNAGGSGGGGFCAIAARPAPGAAALLVAAFAARRLRRRRRAARPKGGARNHKAS